MRKLTLSRWEQQWPPYCASCEGVATGKASSTCAVVTDFGYFVFFYRKQTQYTTITYPVCSRHKFLSSVAGLISARNLINLTIGVVWAYLAFFLLVRLYWLWVGMPVDLDVLSKCAALVLLGIGLFYFGRRFTPIKVTNATDDTVTLLFQSDAYAQRFIDANQALIRTGGAE